MSLIKIQSGKGQHHAGCICTDNIDLQEGICAVGRADGYNNKEDVCSYCYAKYLFSDTKYSIKPPITVERFSTEINRRNREKVKEKDSSKEVRHVRFGKMKDVWDPTSVDESYATLMSALKACNELDKPVMVMTKLLPFYEEIAVELITNNDSVIHYSLGDDALEKGAVKLGMSNINRVETAKKYWDYGVNTYLRICADVVQPIKDDIKNYMKYDIPLLITPLRYSSRELFESNTGLKWEEASNNGYKFDKGALRPQVIHPSWGDKNDHAYCGVVGDSLGCNGCGLYGGRKRWVKE